MDFVERRRSLKYTVIPENLHTERNNNDEEEEEEEDDDLFFGVVFEYFVV